MVSGLPQGAKCPVHKDWFTPARSSNDSKKMVEGGDNIRPAEGRNPV